MMQLPSEYSFIALILIIIGMALILLGGIWRARKQKGESETKSKGVILLGPIPIVWGFGEKGKIVALILAILVIVFYLLIFL